MVDDGRMPRPKRLGGKRRAWDIRALDRPLIVCLLTAMMLGAIKHGATSMPRKLPPFVERWRDRHGKIRVYFRKDRGPRIPLPDTIGSDEFNVAYEAALLGRSRAGSRASCPRRGRHNWRAHDLLQAERRIHRPSRDDQARIRLAVEALRTNTVIAPSRASRVSASSPAFCNPMRTGQAPRSRS